MFCYCAAAVWQEIDHRGIATALEVIDKARVPIVKMKDKISGLAFDICFDVENGPVSSAFVRSYVMSRRVAVMSRRVAVMGTMSLLLMSHTTQLRRVCGVCVCVCVVRFWQAH